MHLTPDTMKKKPFQIKSINTNVLHTAAPHYVHDYADNMTQTLTRLVNGVYNVNLARSAGGDTVYLPFKPDEIHSMRLPANPGAGDATTLLTANLDGCCMFIDKKTNGDIIVYHGNAAAGVTPTAQQSATMPTFQTAGCLQQLDVLYNGAAAYYNGTPNAHHVALKKARYLREVDLRLQRKNAAARTSVTFAGAGAEHGSLTMFAGFYTGGRWEFWFQTYSQFIYQRPANSLKAKLGFGTVNPDVTHDPYEIMDAARFYP
jgi:hypothetical protein